MIIPKFKKGDRLVCIDASGSANILKTGVSYIVKSDSFYFEDIECVTLENIPDYNFFFEYRFKKITEDRKQKLIKLNKL